MAKKLAEHTPGRKIFSSKIATVVVWAITIIWTVPTLGLLSFCVVLPLHRPSKRNCSAAGDSITKWKKRYFLSWS